MARAGVTGFARAFPLAFTALVACVVCVCASSCARREAPVREPVYRFVDHLEEARVEGNIREQATREIEVFASPLEADAVRVLQSESAAPGALVPFAGFATPPEAGAGARAAWR
ncbi:MAG: hypothetical protein ACKVU1_16735, partial [bacterium]